jgi:hypothetical protein
MYLEIATQVDLHEVRRHLLANTGQNRKRVRPDGLITYDELKGLVIRSDNGLLLGASLFGANGGQLLSSCFHSNLYNVEVGRLLVSGLVSIAQQSQLDSIWVISELDQDGQKYMQKCGFKLMAFCKSDAETDSNPAMQTAYWRLDHSVMLQPWYGKPWQALFSA